MADEWMILAILPLVVSPSVAETIPQHFGGPVTVAAVVGDVAMRRGSPRSMTLTKPIESRRCALQSRWGQMRQPPPVNPEAERSIQSNNLCLARGANDPAKLRPRKHSLAPASPSLKAHFLGHRLTMLVTQVTINLHR